MQTVKDMAAGPLDYEELQTALARAGALSSAAEVHGSLCGVLCAAGSGLTDAWRAEMLRDVDPDNAQSKAANERLDDLQLESWRVLTGSSMAFSPLLPSDDSALAERVLALTDWCSGFLFGLSLSGVVEGQLKGSDSEEIVRDFAEISRATEGRAEDAVQEDFAFAELVEYVRVGVQLVFEELAPSRESGAGRELPH